MHWSCVSWASSDIPTVSVRWRFASRGIRAYSSRRESEGLLRTAEGPSSGSREAGT